MTERALGQIMAAPDTAAVPLIEKPAKRRARPKLGLRTVLTGLVLLTVAVTAILIHLTWFYASRRNVADVVGQLNRQIVASVQHEVRAPERRLVGPGGGSIDLLSGGDKADRRGEARIHLSSAAAVSSNPFVDRARLSRRRVFRGAQGLRRRDRHGRGEAKP